MAQREPILVRNIPGHWYVDRDQRSHAYPDAACKPAKPPTWAKRVELGFRIEGERRLIRA